ncbi:MAG: hypothetical protein A2Y94_09690 [Caldithrix sp. RBG_13_44_9]|nr:MAG: hypothetical protein A2Y94_09690 [Caldithrix sp. RBG_13_44_9]
MKFRYYLFSLLILPALLPLYSQVNFSSSNLPIIVLDTYGQPIPNEPKIPADMGIIYNGPGIRNYLTDPFNHFDGHIGIEIRGSSSQMFPKKSYAVETRDSLGNNLNVSLLGMPEENDWILYAPYTDKTMLRDILTFKIGRDLGHYASRFRFCEMVLNGDYQGVYVLLEKIKRDRNRVDIRSMQPGYITGDELTGGYIIKIDKFDGSLVGGWNSQFPPYPGAWQQIYYQYHYPDPVEIVPEQQAYIQGYIFQFESLMNSTLYRDPFIGYYDFVNVPSFIDFFLVSELGKNVDSYRLSTFMYKDRDSEGGRLTMGPLWDFNLAFGNADYYNGWYTSGWQLNVSITGDYWQNPFWWYKLLADPIFMNRTARRWYELRENILSSGSLLSFIDSCTVELDESQTRNYLQWPILGTYVWPNWFIGQTYQDEINFLKTWLQNRINWMNLVLNSQYTRIDWTAADSLELSAEVGLTLKVPLTAIAHNQLNVDSITFISRPTSLSIISSADTVIFLPQQAGEYAFKGLGWQNGQIVELSPPYTFNATSTTISEEPLSAPEYFVLLQNYPNPFNTSTIISWQLTVGNWIKLSIYDLSGREVAVMVNEKQEAGYHHIEFDASSLASGIYIYQLSIGSLIGKSEGLIESKKMIFLK